MGKETFDVIEYAEERKKKSAGVKKSEERQSFDVERYAKRRSLSKDIGKITDRIDSFQKNFDSYLSEFNKRFEGDRNAAYAPYREDSGEWKRKAEAKSSEFLREMASIRSAVDYYSDVLDDKWYSDVSNMFDTYRKYNSELAQAARLDDERWNSYGSREQYEKIMGREHKNDHYYELLNRDDFESGADAGQKLGTDYDDFLSRYTDWYNKKSGFDLGSPHSQEELDEYYRLLSEEPSIQNKLEFFLGNADHGNEAIGWANAGDSTTPQGYVGKLFQQGYNSAWNYATDEERKIYDYLLYRDSVTGGNSAQTYLDDMEYTWTKKLNAANSETVSEFADASALNRILLSAASVPASVIGNLISAPAMIADAMGGREFNPYSASQGMRNFGNMARGSVSGYLEDNYDLEVLGHKVLSEVYNAGMSGVDSALGAMTLGAFYLPVMGSGAAAQKAAELYENGASNEKILAMSIAAGAAEIITEKIPLDNLLKPKNVASLGGIIREALKQAGIEGLEEIGSDVINGAAEDIFGRITGENSSFDDTVKKLMAANPGMSESEAIRKAWISVATDALWSGIGGMISGGGSAAVVAGSSVVRNFKSGSRIKKLGNGQAMVDYALKNYDGDTAVYKAAKRLSAKYAKRAAADKSEKTGSRKSNIIFRIGKALGSTNEKIALGAIQNAMKVGAVTNYVDAEEKAAAEKDIRSLLADEGITDAEESEALARAISKQVEGKTLSEKEKELLANSKAATSVLGDINDSIKISKALSSIDYGVANSFSEEKIS